MNEQKLRNFLEKLATGDYTNEEYASFANWIDGASRDDYQRMLALWEDIVDTREFSETPHPELIRNIEAGLDRIDESETTPAVPLYREKQSNAGQWRRIAVAASILLALSAGGYFTLHKTAKPTQQIAQLKPGTFKNDAVPGNKAILTLANGQQMAVASVPAGHIQNTNIQKTVNGALVYQPSDAAPDVYNTLTVPRGGGKHELRLADGTLAVLDAGSSMRFPIAFNGNQRQVEITGQVYFEVVLNEAKPFSVKVNDAVIKDLGTHFNINAFGDEPGIKTTLLEGSLAVSTAGAPGMTLKPGQQAIVANGKVAIKNGVDLSEVIAWKNDLFKFTNNTSLQTVMNQLSRWYDMDVVYEGKGKTYHFGGDMPRYSKLSDVLKILAYNGVQFSVDGKKIIVYQ